MNRRTFFGRAVAVLYAIRGVNAFTSTSKGMSRVIRVPLNSEDAKALSAMHYTLLEPFRVTHQRLKADLERAGVSES